MTIGLNYAFDKITPMRDEVLGQWIEQENNYSFYTYLSIDGNGPTGPIISAIRNSIFIRELPLALEAIRYGDSAFFSAHPELDQCPIMVYFISETEKYNRIENWGTFSDYITSVE